MLSNLIIYYLYYSVYHCTATSTDDETHEPFEDSGILDDIAESDDKDLEIQRLKAEIQSLKETGNGVCIHGIVWVTF